MTAKLGVVAEMLGESVARFDETKSEYGEDLGNKGHED